MSMIYLVERENDAEQTFIEGAFRSVERAEQLINKLTSEKHADAHYLFPIELDEETIMNIIKVPAVRVAIYHPEDCNYQVLLCDEHGNRIGEVTFEGTPEQQLLLANEYFKFKEDQLASEAEKV